MLRVLEVQEKVAASLANFDAALPTTVLTETPLDDVCLTFVPKHVNHPLRVLVGDESGAFVLVHEPAAEGPGEAHAIADDEDNTESIRPGVSTIRDDAKAADIIVDISSAPFDVQSTTLFEKRGALKTRTRVQGVGSLSAQQTAHSLHRSSTASAMPFTTKGLLLPTARLVASGMTTSGITPSFPVIIQCRSPNIDYFVFQQRAEDDDEETTVLKFHTVSHKARAKKSDVESELQGFDGRSRMANYALYNLIGAVGTQSKLDVEVLWNGETPLLSDPSAKNTTRVLMRAFPEEKSCTRAYHREVDALTRLQNVVAIAEEQAAEGVSEMSIEDAWCQIFGELSDESAIAIDNVIRSKVQSLLDSGAVDATNDTEHAATKAHGAFHATCDEDTSSQLFTLRAELDLPENVWLIAKECETYGQLRYALSVIFKAMKNGSLKPVVHHGNTCQMAQLAVACARANRASNFSISGSENVTKMMTQIASDPLAMLSCVIECGVAKVQRDVFSAFMGAELSTQSQLAPFLKCTEASFTHQVDCLERVLRVMDGIVLLRRVIDADHTLLGNYIQQMLQFYAEMRPLCTPLVRIVLNAYSSCATHVRKMCAGMEQSVYSTRIVPTATASPATGATNHFVGTATGPQRQQPMPIQTYQLLHDVCGPSPYLAHAHDSEDDDVDGIALSDEATYTFVSATETTLTMQAVC